MPKYTITVECIVRESATRTIEANNEAEAFAIAAHLYTDGVAGMADLDFSTDEVTELDFYMGEDERHPDHYTSLEQAEKGEYETNVWLVKAHP